MPLGEVCAIVLLSLGLIAAGRRRYAWPGLLVVGVADLGCMAFVVWRDGLWWKVIAGPISGTMTLATLLIALVAWTYVLGLPRPIALRLGIGLMSRPIPFHNRLLELVKAFLAALGGAREHPDRRDAQLALAERSVGRMRSLGVRDPALVELRDELASECSSWIERVRADAWPDVPIDVSEVPVFVRWAAMREQAARDQRALATPARRRRGEAIWCLSLALAAVLVGAGHLPSAISRGPFTADGLLVAFWFAICAAAMAEFVLRISGRHGPGWA